jgi:hypothetical protein
MVFSALAAGATHPAALMDLMQHPVLAQGLLNPETFPWQQVGADAFIVSICGPELGAGSWLVPVKQLRKCSKDDYTHGLHLCAVRVLCLAPRSCPHFFLPVLSSSLYRRSCTAAC